MGFTTEWVFPPGASAWRSAYKVTKLYPAGKTLVPGYKITSAEAGHADEPTEQFNVVVQDIEYEDIYAFGDLPIRTGIRAKVKKAWLRATVELAGLTFRGEPLDLEKWAPFGTRPGQSYTNLTEVIAARDDGALQKAAFRALEGEWHRPERTAPPVTELGAEDDPVASAAPSAPVAALLPMNFSPVWLAVALTAAGGIGLFARWRARKARRDDTASA